MRKRSEKSRRLELAASGKWYIVLTLAVGVVALTSGNNVLYWIESLLLAGLILSGVLSERVLAAATCEIRRSHASARARSPDRIEVRNPRSFPLFCVEIGEWNATARVLAPIAYVPYLGAGDALRMQSTHVFESRGIHRWDAIAIATRYPFGFARKIRWVEGPGERIIWPELPARAASSSSSTRKSLENEAAIKIGEQLAEGEVRPCTQDDDARMIVWTLSAKGLGPMVRVRREERPEVQVVLDLRTPGGPAFEKAVKRAAARLDPNSPASNGARLTLRDSRGRKIIRSRKAALDRLALAKAEGGEKP